MAARRRKKSKNQEGLGLLGIPIAIWYVIKEHTLGSILVAGVIVTGILLFIAYKKKKRAEYLKWFYDRNRNITVLNANDCIDVELTKAIEEAAKSGKCIAVGNETISFKELRKLYNTVMNSNDVVSSNRTLQTTKSDAITGKYGVNAKCDPLVFRYIGENNGGYVFYVFPETTIVFVEGPEKKVFLAAYYPDTIKFEYDEGHKDFQRVVPDRTQYSINRYYKYCPVQDAPLIKAWWNVTNKDGSRSFRGGLKPEHNPINFRLLYGQIVLRFGAFSEKTSFSNCEAVREYIGFAPDVFRMSRRRNENRFKTSYSTKEEIIDEEPVSNRRSPIAADSKEEMRGGGNVAEELFDNPREVRPEAEPIRDDVFTKVDAKVSKDTPRERVIVSDGRTASPKTEVVSEDGKNQEIASTNNEAGSDNASIEHIRYRNREIVKSMADKFEHKYGDAYDVSTYQVRKVRPGWNLQDAGVYLKSFHEHGDEYNIGFSIHTNIDKHVSNLKFTVWGKSREATASKYKTAVTKMRMKEDGNGYCVYMKRDYENMKESEIAAAFEKDVFTLMRLIEFDTPVNKK